MFSIKTELILASENKLTGNVIYTFKHTFPRIILSEINTHKIVSKNTASSRAIPTSKQLKNIISNPFLPISIGWYNKGMQSGAEITGWRRWTLEQLWLVSRYVMVGTAFLCWKLGAAKQFSNRLVEPWMWVEQISTTTDVENESLLRDHPDAEPHYHELARQRAVIIQDVKSYFATGAPKLYAEKCQRLGLDEWHMPFMHNPDTESYETLEKLCAFSTKSLGSSLSVKEAQKKISVAMCAWVSYYMPGQDLNTTEWDQFIRALNTYKKLIESNPRHLSPAEHVATPLPQSVRCGNFCGWLQHRKELKGEAGGDKVVMSITPEEALDLIQIYKDTNETSSDKDGNIRS